MAQGQRDMLKLVEEKTMRASTTLIISLQSLHNMTKSRSLHCDYTDLKILNDEKLLGT